MDCGGKKQKPALGFLSVLEDEKHGLFGGYLLLNVAGRPLEFHCTAPIRPNRAQEILYGPTLEAFLYGEQIAQTLITKAKRQAAVVYTDRLAVLAVREYVSLPVAYVFPEEQTQDASVPISCEGASRREEDGAKRGNTTRVWRHDGPHHNPPHLVDFDLGRNRLGVDHDAAADRQTIVDQVGSLGENLDLAEPFTRIHEAIREAQKAVR